MTQALGTAAAPQLAFWPAWATGREPRTSEKDVELQSYFSSWVQREVPWLWTGQSPVAWTKDEHECLRESLLAGTVRSSLNEIKLATWWDHLIVAANRLMGCKITLLAPIMRIPTPLPNYVRNDFMLLAQFRAVESEFLACLQSGKAAMDAKSLFVCSAVVFAGVTSVALLDAILRIKLSRVHFHDGDVFVALEMPLGQGQTTYATWFPERMTAALMLRWLETSEAEPTAVPLDSPTDIDTPRLRVSKAVQDALTQLKLPMMSWQDFLQAAHVATSLQLSPFLAHYLHGTFASRAMHPAVYQRLNDWVVDNAYQVQEPAALQESAPDILVSNECLQVSADVFDPLKMPANQLRFIKEIRRILTKTSKASAAHVAITKWILRSEGVLWPITRLLAQWVAWRLGSAQQEGDVNGEEKGEVQAEVDGEMKEEVKGEGKGEGEGKVKRSSKSLATSSARRYLSAIARHLITELGPEEVLELEPEDFETFYEEAGACVKADKEKPVYWMCVSAFHDYLTFSGAPQIDMEDLDGYEGARGGSGAANVVSEREFQVFKRELLDASHVQDQNTDQGTDQDTHQPQAHPQRLQWLLVAILGFRCGLRRREVQMLWMHDLHPGDFPVLIVRASRLATLKSKSSHRRIPLWALLAKDELAWFTQYWKARSESALTADGLLFSRANAPTTPLEQSLLFDPITRAFGRILEAGGPRFRFHCLRHSFANWTLLKLLVADNPQWVAHIPLSCVGDRVVFAKSAQALREAAFPELAQTQHAPSRRSLYLVGALLGHLSPNTTVRYYISILGWLAQLELNEALSRRLAHWTHIEVAHACGLSYSATTKAPYKGLIATPMDFLGKFAEVHLPQCALAVQAKPGKPLDLSAEFSIAQEQTIAAPAQLLGLLTLRIRLEERLRQLKDPDLASSTRQAMVLKFAQRHGMTTQTMELAYDAYQLIYAGHGQKVSQAKMGREFPAVPSHSKGKSEFWRILDQTQASWSDASKRDVMVLAANRWSQRVGYHTAALGLGEHASEVQAITQGLMACGIGINQLSLQARVDDPSSSAGEKNARHVLTLTQAAKTAGSLGMAYSQVTGAPPTQPERRRRSQDLLLRISQSPENDKAVAGRRKRTSKVSSGSPPASPPPASPAGLGIVRGLNYASVWILFANSIVTS